MDWNGKQRLINVTGIQSNGSPITTQMRDASMGDVERRVMCWDADALTRKIIRVFINVKESLDSEHAVDNIHEYQVDNGVWCRLHHGT